MLITLELHHILRSNLHTYAFKHFRDTGMQNGDKGLPRISLSQLLNHMVYFDQILHT